MWKLQPPPGFQGFREDKPLDIYFRRLPHWRQEGATYFVTFRLADFLPQSKLDELVALRRRWEEKHRPPYSRELLEKLAREITARTERWLDLGMGSCVLKEPSLAALLAEAMHHFDGERYELGADVVMPNHAHAILRPLQTTEHPLETLFGSWKQFSSRRINERMGGEDNLWQEESFDRIVRDEEHLYRCIQYIGRNPKNAGLKYDACPLWINPEWVKLGWRFDV